MPLVNMRLIKQMNNLYLFQSNDIKIWFSYETPIAYEIEGIIVVRKQWFSKTTSKHQTFLKSFRSMDIPPNEFMDNLKDLMKSE